MRLVYTVHASVTMSFVLVFWSDPPCSSVINKTEVVGNVDVGQRRFIKWHGKELLGKIIKTGNVCKVSSRARVEGT